MKEITIRNDSIIDRLAKADGELASLSTMKVVGDKRRVVESLGADLNRIQREVKMLDMDCRMLPSMEYRKWKLTMGEYRLRIKNITREVSWAKTEIETPGGNAIVDDVLEIGISVEIQEKRLAAYGSELMLETEDAASNTLSMIAESRDLGSKTCVKLAIQSEQLNKVHDTAFEIEEDLERAMFIVKRMSRRLATDKCLWVLIVLIILAAIGAGVAYYFKQQQE